MATTTTTRIVGGTQVASQDVYTWFTAIETRGASSGQSFDLCGASLLAADVVLTAAHCAFAPGDTTPSSNPTTDWQVRMNAFNSVIGQQGGENEQQAVVLTHQFHPNYEQASTRYDFLLLKVATVTNAPTKFVTVKNCEQQFSAGDLLTVIGLGALQTAPADGSAPQFPGQLMEAKVGYVTDTQCNAFIVNPGERSAIPWSAILCAGFDEGGIDSCQGDSGGPLFFQESSDIVQVGVVSFGAGCALPQSPGVYAQTSNVHTWINCFMTNKDDDTELATCASTEKTAKDAIITQFASAESLVSQVGAAPACEGPTPAPPANQGGTDGVGGAPQGGTDGADHAGTTLGTESIYVPVIAGVVALAVLGVLGLFAYKKLSASRATTVNDPHASHQAQTQPQYTDNQA